MRRKRTDSKTAESDESEQGQHIGHITTPIEDKESERVKVLLTRHAVHVEKIRSPDNWYTLFLPDRTRQIKKGMEGIATLYAIHLPDGYQFTYRAPIFNHDKSYHIFPMITVLEEEE